MRDAGHVDIGGRTFACTNESGVVAGATVEAGPSSGGRAGAGRERKPRPNAPQGSRSPALEFLGAYCRAELRAADSSGLNFLADFSAKI